MHLPTKHVKANNLSKCILSTSTITCLFRFGYLNSTNAHQSSHEYLNVQAPIGVKAKANHRIELKTSNEMPSLLINHLVGTQFIELTLQPALCIDENDTVSNQ